MYSPDDGGNISKLDVFLVTLDDDTMTDDQLNYLNADFGFQDLELPVKLLNFNAKVDKDHIDLLWVNC